MEGNTSRQLYCARAFAILCTVAAHMPGSGIEGRILDMLGTIGVPFFLFSAGLLYNKEKGPRWRRFGNKVWCPWLFGGTVIWLIGIVLGYNAMPWWEFLVGKGSYLYYLTVSLVLYAVFDYTPPKLVLPLFLLGMGRMLSFYMGYSPAYAYLAVLYWLPYFAAGILAKRWLGSADIGKTVKRLVSRPIIIVPLWCLLSALYLFRPDINYFNWYALPYSVVSILFLLWLGKVCANQVPQIGMIGKQTLAIYIWHIYCAGFVSERLRAYPYIHILSPLLVLIGVFWGLELAVRICRRLPFGEKCAKLIGLQV